MSQLIQNMNNVQTDFDQQLRQAIGMDSLHLEDQWRLQLGQSTVLSPDQVTPTPQPIVHPKQHATATDSTTPILVSTGILLILLPIIGIVGIFVFQRRKQRHAVATQVAPNYRAMNGTAQPYPPFQPNGSFNYTNPAQYMPPQQGAYPYQPPQQLQQGQQPAHLPQTYMPFAYPTAEQAFGAPVQPAQASQASQPPQPQQNPQYWQNPHNQSPGYQPVPQRPLPTNTPGFQWSANFPPTGNGQFPANGNGSYPSSYSDKSELPPEPFSSFQEGIPQQPRQQAPQD